MRRSSLWTPRWLVDLLRSLGLLLVILVALVLATGFMTDIKLSELWLMVRAMFLNEDKIARIVVTSVPLWLTALAFSLPLKAGFFNVGADGQLAVGTFGAAVSLLLFTPVLPIGALASAIVVCLVVPLVAGGVGAAWVGLALLLRRRFGVHEVVSTLLLNFVAFGVIGAALQGIPNLGDWTGGSQGLKTEAFSEEIRSFTQILSFKGATVTVYAFYALGILGLTHFGLWHTHPGLRLRAVGSNPDVGEFAGIDVRRVVACGAVLGGCLAGLAGLNQLISAGRFDLAHYQSLGFEGLAVALLGRHRFSGIILIALLLCAWRHLTNDFQRLGMPAQLYWVGQGLAIIAFVGFVRRDGGEV